MKDRVPKYPGRVKLTPVSGQENTYDMERADEAIVTGDALNKANLLPDAVAKTLGLTQENPQVKDALLALLLATGNGSVTIQAYAVDGSPYAGLKISGLPITDSQAYTDTSGKLTAYVKAGTYTLTSSATGKYLDCDMARQTITVTAGQNTSLVWRETAKTDPLEFITSSATIRFSKNVDEVDVFCVGGGGSGAHNTGSSSTDYSGGGGGGYTATGINVAFTPETEYPAIVGAGAVASETANQGNQGGTSSLLGVSAAGGKGGGYREGGDGGSGGAVPGGAGGSDGNDATGAGGLTPGKGQGHTTRPFGDETDDSVFSGGGGASGAEPGELGGGAYCEDGLENTGGGGGGGGHNAGQPGGSGGSGIIMVRWRNKT